MQVLEKLERAKRQDYNSLTRTGAIGFSGILNSLSSLGGSKQDPIKPTAFLAFPDEANKEPDKLSKATRDAVIRLYKSGSLPPILEPILLELNQIKEQLK